MFSLGTPSCLRTVVLLLKFARLKDVGIAAKMEGDAGYVCTKIAAKEKSSNSANWFLQKSREAGKSRNKKPE
jgi:hypothetical protein